MTSSNRRILCSLSLSLGLGLLLAFAVLALAPRSAQAQQARECVATIGSNPVSQHASYGNALDLSYQREVEVGLASTQPLGNVTVSVEAGPFRREITPSRVATGRQGASWAALVSVQEQAHNGVGLYKLVLTGDGCRQTAWINITGKGAITTTLGGGAGLTMILGLGSQLFSWFKALRDSHGRWWAVLGGLLLGIGACVLSQQLGLTPIEPKWLGIWTAPSIAIGSIIQNLLAASGRRGQSEATAAPGSDTDGPVFGDVTPPPPAPPPPPPIVLPPAESPPPPVVLPPRVPPGTTRGGGSASSQLPETAPPPHEEQHQSAEPPADLPESSPPVEADPPRSAYALVKCPDAVVAAEEFELSIGLSPEEVAGVAGPALRRPGSSSGAYTLTVQVVADGFELREGEHWRNELPVTAAAAYPVTVLHLTPADQPESVKPRAIQAIYSVDGQAMGMAVRPVAVVRSRDLLSAAAAEPAEGVTIAAPATQQAADLTVRIQRGTSESGGRLLWTFDTPHKQITLPDAPVITDVGKEPERFARQLVDGVGLREGQPGLYTYLVGIGLTVADEMPHAFWEALTAAADVAKSQGRPPYVFILSEEPYVPWELAVVDPPIDTTPGAAPFLGAQACVGRWVLGQRRPKLPPPAEVNIGSMAVIWGEYDQPGWNRLVEAEKEAAALSASYGAASVKATTTEVLACLGGVPAADAIHFAVHGIYDPNSVMNGLVLVDGLTLDPLQVKGNPMRNTPFVFLNACQVGSGNSVLGDYGGLAEAFLYAGAGGVVAPFWSIKDTVAHEIALRFYEQAFQGISPAELLRRERAAFRQDAPEMSATFLAYIWYGDPALRLSRSPSGGS